jgi:hypothetical protein
VSVVELLDALELNDDLALDEQVGPEALLETQPPVLERNSYLPFGPQAPCTKLVCKHGLVNRLQQAGPRSR